MDDIGCNSTLTSIKENLENNMDVTLATVALLFASEDSGYSTTLNGIPSSDAFNEACAAFANYIYCELE